MALTRERMERLLDLYYVSADVKFLEVAIADLQHEMEFPSLQKTILTLDELSEVQVATILQSTGYLRLSADECTNKILIEGEYITGVKAGVEEGKLIRVYPKEYDPETDPNTCVLLQVADWNGRTLILVVPPTGDSIDA